MIGVRQVTADHPITPSKAKLATHPAATLARACEAAGGLSRAGRFAGSTIAAGGGSAREHARSLGRLRRCGVRLYSRFAARGGESVAQRAQRSLRRRATTWSGTS